MFVYMIRVKSILEIGMFIGYLVLVMVEVLLEDGWMVVCEVD